MALYTSGPKDADTGTEVSGGGYARVFVNQNGGGVPQFNLAVTDGDGKLVDNADDIEFPVATAPWGTITHFAARDAAYRGKQKGSDLGSVHCSYRYLGFQPLASPLGAAITA